MAGSTSLYVVYLYLIQEIVKHHIQCLKQKKNRYMGLFGLFFFFFCMRERHLFRSWGSEAYVACRKCVLSLALHTPSLTSTSSHFLVSDDAVTSLCCVEVEVAPMQDEQFTTQVNESKYTSEQEVNHHRTHCETICFSLLVCVLV